MRTFFRKKCAHSAFTLMMKILIIWVFARDYANAETKEEIRSICAGDEREANVQYCDEKDFPFEIFFSSSHSFLTRPPAAFAIWAHTRHCWFVADCVELEPNNGTQLFFFVFLKYICEEKFNNFSYTRPPAWCVSCDLVRKIWIIHA